MRTWERVSFSASCGMCGKSLEHGTPVLVITIENLKRRKIRCEDCAGLKAPPDLPPLIEKSPMTKRMRPIKMAIPSDYVNRLLGERE